jgi:hypothetical protein
MTITKTVIIGIIYIMVMIAIKFYCFNYHDYCNYCDHCDYCHYLLVDRMVGVGWLADCIRARPQPEVCLTVSFRYKRSGKVASHGFPNRVE